MSDYTPEHLATDEPLAVELVEQTDHRLLLLTIAVLGSALLTGMVGTILLALQEKDVPEVLAVTIGAVSGSLGTLLVRSAGSSR